MVLEVEGAEVEIVNGVAAETVDGGDNADDDAKSDHEPEPVFHVDDFEQDVHVVNRDEGFPALFAGFGEDFPGRNDEQNIENDKVD